MMASKHVIQFYAINQLFKGMDRQLKRGEIAYNDGHVLQMDFDSSVKPLLLKGVVQASQRKDVKYKVEIHYDEESGLNKENCKCTCAVGQDLCHHMAALLFFAHYNISSTDVECCWRAPKTKSTEACQSLEQMFPLKESYKAVSGELTAEQIKDFHDKLGATNIVGFSWLLKPEVCEEASSIIPSIEDILYSEEYVKSNDKLNHFQEMCAITEKRIEEIQILTIGQHINENWLISRKLRLTSSKFGNVLSACRRNNYPPSLFKNLLEGYDLHKVKAVQWGKENEKSALAKFTSITGLNVTESGIWLDKCGYLAASPDGLIGNNSTLEIKCPYKYRDGILKEKINEKKDYFYYYSEDGQIVVKVDHIYYHQIQGQLYLTGRDQCYFFVWTPIEYELIVIEKDPQWENNIDVLKDFYLNKFLPFLTNK